MVMRVLKALLVILPLGFGMLMLAHLWPDEAPAYSLGRYPVDMPATRAHPRSLYFALFGFRAPANEDPFARGRLVLETYETTGKVEEVEGLTVDEALSSSNPCSRTEPGCVGQIAQNMEGLDALLEDHAVLLQRYRALYDVPDFRNALPFRFDAPIPKYQDALAMQDLLHRTILRDHAAGMDEQAWAALNLDVAFWRRVLGQADILITKMVAVRALEYGLRLRAHLISGADYEPAPLEPLTTAERSILMSLRSEMQLTLWALQNLDYYGDFSGSGNYLWELLPFKPMATFNRHYEASQVILENSSLPVSEYHEMYYQQEIEPAKLRWHDYLLNGKGAWFLQIAAPHYGEYGVRVHALDALITLVNLKQRLLADGVEPDSIGDRLSDYAPEFSNPFFPDQGPSWDAENSQLHFENAPGTDPSRLNLAIAW